jgi:hypothetical protein
MGGEIAAIVVDRSSWPYATFGMFSYTAPEGRTYRSFVPLGIAKNGGEISLEPCLRPLSPLQIDQGITAALRRSDVAGLLHDTFHHCAARDPSLVRVRIDDVTWQLDPDLDAPPPRRIEVASYP